MCGNKGLGGFGHTMASDSFPGDGSTCVLLLCCLGPVLMGLEAGLYEEPRLWPEASSLPPALPPPCTSHRDALEPPPDVCGLHPEAINRGLPPFLLQHKLLCTVIFKK